ncbi:type II secretion system F family protein [Agromyces sp. MMS24-K17]|uniref:type II secretion system F family protein n=1 Tax=Agromyces sp. MMS24-K17 TaxID=3372850 RepID=UPI003753FB84
MLVVYAAVALVAIGLGVLVFVLFPGRKPVADTAERNVEVHPSLGVVQQRPSLAQSLITAAPAGYAGWLEKQVVYAGRPIGWTVHRIVTCKLVLLVIGVVGGFLFVVAGGPQPLEVLVAIAISALLFFLPDVLINSRAHDRQEALKVALPDTLDQMTIAVEAGLGFDAAMAKAARGGKGPLAEELIRVLQDMSIGRTRRDSFQELERRTSVEDLRRFIRAVIQADAYGVAIGEVLRVQAGEMRLKRRQRAEEQAQKVTVKILFPLVFCLLPVLFIVVMTPAVLSIIDSFSSL